MEKIAYQSTSTVCEECDLVVSVPQLSEGEQFNCPRCSHTLVNIPLNLIDNLIGTGIAAFVFLALSLIFPFLSFSTHGIGQSITFLDTIITLIEYQSMSLGILLALLLLVLPVSYLVIIQYIAWSLKNNVSHPEMGRGIHWLSAIQPWLMVDVFLIGVMVALIKLSSLADISMGLSFWSFCGFVILLARSVSLINQRWLWQAVAGKYDSPAIEDRSASSQKVTGCHSCGAVVTDDEHECPHCNHSVHLPHKASLNITTALIMASCIMYIPANVFPIMTTTFLGQAEPSTILGGVFILWGMGSYPIALVILIASVVVPLAKIIALSWLCWQSWFPKQHSAQQSLSLYRMTELVGRWSMVDVFVVAILTGVVQLGGIMTIEPNIAAVSFATVVILTMLAAITFDSRLLWAEEKTLDN